ncbi:lipopolysaccharide biosynthesis protein [Photobacterium carnosum]|uniref:lipopolysaccharide biosynthesis protein n=1 Tax=Photobacterium carnosum TaxID=2023717 RepID=UPI001E5DBDB0|nr:hypothetical protein [Photobacterium carnosum]MCD9529094.1 hypothetical protein [Photobacterium carnosum]
MRSRSAVKNASSLFFNIILITLLNIFYRTIFVKTLGVEYLGLSSLISNILLLLSLAELGLAQAISYSLYKPLSNKEYGKIVSLMFLFKKAYFFIFLLMFFLGVIVSQYLSDFNGDNKYLNYQVSIFVLMLSSILVMYLFSYKRILIIADQKNYKITSVINICSIIDILVKIIILIKWPTPEGLVIALSFQLIMKLIENYLINKKINKLYKFIFSCEVHRLDPIAQREVIKNVKAMFFHKLGDSIMNGTDNILISKFVSLFMLGIYSNYFLIINTGIIILNVLFNSLTSILGSVIAEKNNFMRIICDSINFLGLLVFGLSSIYIILFSSNVIELWFGSEYTLEKRDIYLMAINFLFMGFRVPLNVIKSSSGIYDQDKYAPLFQSGINIIVSILLAINYGLSGVLIGTLISNIIVPLWYRPYIVYKYLFNDTCYDYFKKLMMFIIFWILVLLFSIFINNNILVSLSVYSLLIKFLIITFVYSLTAYLFFYKSNEFIFIKKRLSLLFPNR